MNINVVTNTETSNEGTVLVPGIYKVKTTAHGNSGMVAGWGLSAFVDPNDCLKHVPADSTYVAVHEGDDWPCLWKVERSESDTYTIETVEHKTSKQPGGWKLCATPIGFNLKPLQNDLLPPSPPSPSSDKRNDNSTKVFATGTAGDYNSKWKIVKGKKEGTWRNCER